jgi:hypothetical protein
MKPMNARFLTKFWSLLSVLLVLSLVAAPAAFADVINNNVSGDGLTRTINPSGSTTVDYWIVAVGEGDTVPGCNALDGTPATITVNAPAGVIVSPTSRTYTRCKVGSNNYGQSFSFTSATPGLYTIDVSVSDAGPGSYETSAARFYLRVLDNTPPLITPSIGGTLGNNGWYTSDVTVSWSVVDNESTITSSPCTSTTIDEDTAGTTLTCSATSAGGTASESVTIKRDATDPEVSLEGDLLDSDSYYYWFVPEAPTCAASDAMSGLDGECSVSGYGDGVGPHTVTASATDMAGNDASSDSHTYTVLSWTLSGFYQPVDMGGVWNTVKGGSTVPFKFEIFAGSAELTNTSAVASLTATLVPCEAGAPEDAVEATATGGTSLRYDAGEGQFIFNWQTPRQPGKCYEVTVTAQDGSEISAYMKLK